jgi:hypothetical protein
MARAALRLSDHTDPATEMLARRIIDLAIKRVCSIRISVRRGIEFGGLTLSLCNGPR